MREAQTITDLNQKLITNIMKLSIEQEDGVIMATTFADNVKVLLTIYWRERNRINGK